MTPRIATLDERRGRHLVISGRLIDRHSLGLRVQEVFHERTGSLVAISGRLAEVEFDDGKTETHRGTALKLA